MIPNFTSPRLQKKYISLPTWRRLKAFLKKKNMDNPKATILKCSSRLGWYLGTGPFGGIIKERRFTSTCHTLKPTQQEGFRSQNYLQDSTKARIICVFSHCTSSEHDYRMKYEYLEYIFQPSSQCLSESQKKYTSTKLSAGGMPVSFSGSDLGRQKKSHQAFEVLFKKMMICIFTNKHSFKKISTPGLQDFLSFTTSKGVIFPEETPFGTRWIFPHFGPCP